MGKWDIRTDFKTIQIPLVFVIVFVVYVIASQKLNYVSSVFLKDETVFIGTKLYFYFQFIISFFVMIISSTMFEETYRQPALSYIRTLPLRIHQIWTLRYFRLLVLFLVIILPVLLLGIKQVNYGINEFVITFDLQIQNTTMQVWPILFNCIIFINFYFLITQTIMILTKNRIITCSILFTYYLMEAGPLGGFLTTNALFYGSFSPIPISFCFLSNQIIVLIGSVILEVFIAIWYRVNFTAKRKRKLNDN